MVTIVDEIFFEHEKLTALTLSKCHNFIIRASKLLEEIFNPNPEKRDYPITRRKLFLFGNGGSAADAQHIAAEFTNRFSIDREPLPAIALTTDTSALTAISNDFNYKEIFSKQISALGNPGDVAIGISTSGTSPNVRLALDRAKEMGIKTILLTGNCKVEFDKYDVLIKVPSYNTARIQEMHILIGHVLCKLVDVLYEKIDMSHRTNEKEYKKKPNKLDFKFNELTF